MAAERSLRGAWRMLPRPLAFLLLATPATAEIALVPPIACQLGPDCFIQNHVDHDPGPGHRDFACGHLGYDGHTGTDFALATLAQMRAGVAVLAPAPGRVRASRDGMADVASNAPDAPPRNGRDCGNAVIIDHAEGYSTQLCHLAQGSVTVRAGDRVSAGQPIARVGLSGLTEFPHVHMTLRQGDRVIDPFQPDPLAARDQCDAGHGPGLWAEPLAYVPARLTGLGLTTTPPDFSMVQEGLPNPDRLPADAPMLVLWVTILGPRAGDRLALRLTGPAGTVVDTSETLTADQARSFRFAGRRLPGHGWPAGTYLAEVELQRGGQAIDTRSHKVTITAAP